MINLTESEKTIITKMQAGARANITHAHLVFANTRHTFAELLIGQDSEPIKIADVENLTTYKLIQFSTKEEGTVGNGATFVKDFYELTEVGKIWPNDLLKPEVKNSNLMKLLPFIVGGITALLFILIYTFS